MSETELTVGDRVRTVYMPSKMSRNAYGEEPSEVVGEVVDIVEETKHTGVNSTLEQTLVVVEGDDGIEKRVNIDHLDAELDSEYGGTTLHLLDDESGDEDEDEDQGEGADQSDDEHSDDEADAPAAADVEAVADGGEDVTAHVDDAVIEEAIKRHDDPDHEDAYTVAEIRELLAALQRSADEMWGEWLDNIERGDTTVVAETDDLLVLDTGEWAVYEQELDPYDGPVAVDDIALDIIEAVHHDVARAHSDRDWGYTYPYVVRKPDRFDAGQGYVEAIVNGLQRRGLAPGQAWAYYGVAIRGESRNRWGRRKGDHDHKNVSEALEKAREKLR